MNRQQVAPHSGSDSRPIVPAQHSEKSLTSDRATTGPGSVDDIAGLAQRWRSTKDPKQRRQICIELMDNGTLKVLTEVSVLKTVFGDDFITYNEEADGSGYALVDFVDPKTRPTTPFRERWYLYVGFEKTRQAGVVVTAYHISNFSSKGF
jgi:hypothetical protein